jgi:hypothetical protein
MRPCAGSRITRGCELVATSSLRLARVFRTVNTPALKWRLRCADELRVILTPWKREAIPVPLDEANDAVVARIDAWLPGLDAPLSWVPVVADAPAPTPVPDYTGAAAAGEAGIPAAS